MQKWHPDKHKGDSAVTTKFQAINKAYTGIYMSSTKEKFKNALLLVLVVLTPPLSLVEGREGGTIAIVSNKSMQWKSKTPLLFKHTKSSSILC